MRPVGGSARTRRLGVLVAVLALLVLTACTPDGTTPPAITTSPAVPSRITVAVYGPGPVLSAYAAVSARFAAENPGIDVDVVTYPTHDAAMTALARTRGTAAQPDIFMAASEDLPNLLETKANQRVDEMLSARNIDFGDGYERSGLEAFSADTALQCMPTEVSPLVVYYNTTLVDLATVRPVGTKPPTAQTGWSLEDFAAAADQASTGTNRGVYVAPTVDQVAPFVFSGGGKLVDDVADPQALTLTDGSGLDAMRSLLQVVRDPAITFDASQLARKSALDRFKQGRLGMMLGYRSLTPRLRGLPGLSFDVMPLPRVGRSATVNQISGLCVRRDLPHPKSTAALLAFLVGDDASQVLASTGYVTPANIAALRSADFRAPGQQPVAWDVFDSQIRYGKPMPRGPVWAEAETVLDAALSALFYDPVIEPFEGRLKQIDTTVTALLSPPTPGPTPGPTPTPGGSASPTPTS